MSQVVHVVLTGGPGGGKSSAKAHLVEALSARNWRVFYVPEAATLVIGGGLSEIGHLAAHDRPRFVTVQKEIAAIQLNLRAAFDALARSTGERSVVIHDRGLLDNAAYLHDDEFLEVLEGFALDPAAAAALYDSVVHLRSAAVVSQGYNGGAYTVANNAARRESAEEAAELDHRTLQAWSAHPHLSVIGTMGSFAEKLERALLAVTSVLGDPEPLEREYKFLLKEAPDTTGGLLGNSHYVDIVQTYLVGDDEQRVRASTWRGTTSFTHTTKRDLGPGVRVEIEESISEQTYHALLGFADPDCRPIHKRRWLVIEGDRRVEVDHLTSPVEVWLAEIEVLTDAAIEPPGFLGETLDVTDDPAWRNSNLARG